MPPPCEDYRGLWRHLAAGSHGGAAEGRLGAVDSRVVEVGVVRLDGGGGGGPGEGREVTDSH